MPDAHAGHMARALALIETAPHRTSPNPTVGCVIVRDGVVVGEGVTRPAGQAHAELVALEAAGERARGAVMYVTLEPCAHFGRTPPCTEAIIAAGVARVFVGTIDPNPLVHGAGLRQLAAAGIHAEVGLLGEACDRVLNPFRRFIRDKRPWVLLKAATTLDGQLAAASGDSKWITGEAARRDAHRLRARVDAVLVGAATARVDDPRLTVRLVEGADPLRVVLDAQATLSPTAALLGPGALVLHAPDAPAERVAALAATGADALTVPRGPGGLDLSAALTTLAERGVVTAMLEGGGRLHGAFLRAGLVDEACVYVAPRLLGRGVPLIDLPSAPTVAQGWSLDDTEITPCGHDVRIRGRIRYPAPG